MTPEAGEKLLAEGKADLIAFGRALFADPALPNKICEGKAKEIRPCILCHRCREDLRHSGVTGVRCTVNAAMGKEAQPALTATGKPKKVLVVGGGPAGMEAARVAATRGHEVTLWEKEKSLGGQMAPAAIAPHKELIGRLTEYFSKELVNAGVDVKLGREATVSEIERFSPDVLVVATGVNATVPDIPGLKEVNTVMAIDVLQGKAKAGERVAIIGGELVACEVAEYLAAQGKKVTMMRRGPKIAANVGPATRIYMMQRLNDANVSMLTGVDYERATKKGIEITTKTGEKKLIPADTFVIAAGATPNESLYHEIAGKVPEIYRIGDCVTPRNLAEATREGYETGMMI
jgi:2,4-dienoyl-CoA reductase (NADPH2)